MAFVCESYASAQVNYPKPPVRTVFSTVNTLIYEDEEELDVEVVNPDVETEVTVKDENDVVVEEDVATVTKKVKFLKLNFQDKKIKLEIKEIEIPTW